MNYLKEIQILKTELALPLQKSKTLLEQTAGDIPAAIALYHQGNITTIMAETECEHWEAESVYERFNYNVEKAVKHIFSTSLTISVEDKRDTSERGMGYLISALDTDLNNVSKRSSNLFAPTVCRKIIAQLRQGTFTDENVKTFIQKVIIYIENRLPTSAYIEVYGNI